MRRYRCMGRDDVTRVAVTLLLPEGQAKALQHAAQCAGMLDAEGRVVMDHFILARDPTALQDAAEQPSDAPCVGRESKPSKEAVQILFEAHFNGA